VSSLHRLPCRRDDVRLHDRETRSFLVDPDGEVAHELNPTARAVWELCDGTTTVDELVDAITQLFSVDRDVAVADVLDIVGQLEEADLVGWTPAATESG
jgi:hypothetical protein